MSSVPIEEIEFTIFDTETTGLDPASGDRIIEIAGLRVKGEKVLGEYESLINPQRPVSAGAFAVHGISDERLRQAPLAAEVIPGFLAFIGGSVLCSYNAPFDMGFLNVELSACSLDGLDQITAVDVLRMARRLLPDIQRHALWFVARTLGIRQDQLHRARSDVEMTWKVFRLFTGMLRQRGIDESDRFFSLFALRGAVLAQKRELTIARIEEAISMGARICIEYLSSSGIEVTRREVLPKEIRQLRGEEYLLGHCCLRGEERRFRVDGILQLEIV